MRLSLLAVAAATVWAQYDPLSGDWIIDWEDNFDGPKGSAPNVSVWIPRTMPGLSGNKELEYYLSDSVFLDGASHVVLMSQPQSYSGYNYTSGWMDTEGLWNATFGRFEIRAKLPTGQGIWPAHWLMPDYTICWPMGGEIDILERIDTIQEVHGALHWNTQECGVPESAGTLHVRLLSIARLMERLTWL